MVCLLPHQPADEDGPVFREPWEAQAFAMTVSLHEQGLFTWDEWAAALSAEIKAAQAAGDQDLGDTYYHHWSRALEILVGQKTDVDGERVTDRAEAWRNSYLATPHGEAVTLRK